MQMDMQMCLMDAQSKSSGTVPPLYIPLPHWSHRLVINDMLEASSIFSLTLPLSNNTIPLTGKATQNRAILMNA